MVSEKLNDKKVFDTEWMVDEKYDPEIKALTDKLVNRLVLTMRIAELNGRMPQDKIERMVVKAFRHAENRYYRFDKHQLKIAWEMEKENDKRRARNKQGV